MEINNLFLEVYNKNKPEGFLLPAINSLDSYRKNALLDYLHNKNILKQDDLPEIYDVAKIINTPHPIGNLNIIQTILMDIILRIDKILYRHKIYSRSEKYKNSDIKYKYLDGDYLDFKIYYIKTLLIDLEPLFSTKIINLESTHSLNELQSLLVQSFLDHGIDQKVISKEQETLSAITKLNYYCESIPKNFDRSIKDWSGIDADGDKNNGMHNLIHKLYPNFFLKYQNFNIIIAYLTERITNNYLNKIHLQQASNEKFQPRISFDREKKGVNGMDFHLSVIAGLDKIQTLNDILDEEKFDVAYQEFIKFLEQKTYSDVNSHIDFILRVVPELIVGKNKAGGLVISDFPNHDDAYQILYKLAFIKKAIFQYANIDIEKINDSGFLLLCENQQSINNSNKIYDQIFDEIKQYVENKTEMLLNNFANLFFANNYFLFGGFYGPSDLTKDMGGMANLVMHNTSIAIYEKWTNFKNEIEKFINIKDIDFMREYGEGTSYRRGADLALALPSQSRTSQGINLISLNSIKNKNYGLIEREMRGGIPESLNIDDDLVELCARNHKYFWGDNMEEPGVIPKEYDRLISDLDKKIFWSILDRKYANNQGARGSDGLHKYSANRAISAASIATLTGLIPLTSFSSLDIFWENCNLQDFIKHPVGLNILIREFYGFIITDSKRAQLLGFSDDLISNSNEYIENCLQKIEKKLNIKQYCNDAISRIKIILNQIINLKLIDNEYMNHYVEQFLDQIDLFAANSKNLTDLIYCQNFLMENSTLSDEDNQIYLSNAALVLNLLTNPILPIMPSSKIKITVRGPEAQSFMMILNIEELKNTQLVTG